MIMERFCRPLSSSGIRTPLGAALYRFRPYKQTLANCLRLHTASAQPSYRCDLAAMAIGKLSIVAAALVVIAIGASAARHPGTQCHSLNVLPTLLKLLIA